MRTMQKLGGLGFTLTLIMILMTACGGNAVNEPVVGNMNTSNDGVQEQENTVQETKNVKLVLNWFPKSQHGGIYTAVEQGIFADHGLEVAIEQGGPQVSAIQLVASGNADFGLAHADQIVIAKDQGVDLVALAATQQGSPQAFMFQEHVNVETFEDLNGRTVFIQPGITYWDYLKNKYDLSDVNEMTYTGQHVNFLANPDSVTQCFVTSEPYFMELQGIKTKTLLVSESGYNPYNVVLFVTKDYLENHKDTVANFVAAFSEGWMSYKNSADEINSVIHEVNPEIALEALQFETETQMEFVYGGDAAEHGFGYMSEDRWETLIDQLLELGLLKEKFDANDIFTTEFLPETNK